MSKAKKSVVPATSATAKRNPRLIALGVLLLAGVVSATFWKIASTPGSTQAAAAQPVIGPPFKDGPVCSV
jgi:hypothetical protein